MWMAYFIYLITICVELPDILLNTIVLIPIHSFRISVHRLGILLVRIVLVF